MEIRRLFVFGFLSDYACFGLRFFSDFIGKMSVYSDYIDIWFRIESLDSRLAVSMLIVFL